MLLQLHSKRTLPCSPKQLKKLGTYIKKTWPLEALGSQTDVLFTTFLRQNHPCELFLQACWCFRGHLLCHKKMANRCTLTGGEGARLMGCWCPLAASSKSVVKEGAFVFSGEGYLSTVIDIQQHWTAWGCTHPSGANHWALPEKFTLPSALQSGCCKSQSTLLRLQTHAKVIYFSFTGV